MNASCSHSPLTRTWVAAYFTLFSLQHRDGTGRSEIFPEQNQQENPNSGWQPLLHGSDQQNTSWENTELKSIHTVQVLFAG